MPTHVSFECLRDKRANWFFAGLADTGRVWYLPSNGKVVVLGLVRREFRRESGVLSMVRSSDVMRLTNLESSLWWSYQTCSIFIPDVSGMHGQRPTASFQMPWGSGVPTWVESSDGRKFRHASGVPTPHKLHLSYLVFKYAEGQEFRSESGVSTVGSFGIHREYRRLTLTL